MVCLQTIRGGGKRGRQQAYSDAAIQACLTIKVLFGLPLRQTTEFVESVLELDGLNWAAQDFSTLCRRQKTLSVAIPSRGSARPLHLLVDSTGIKAAGEGAHSAACVVCACGSQMERSQAWRLHTPPLAQNTHSLPGRHIHRMRPRAGRRRNTGGTDN